MSGASSHVCTYFDETQLRSLQSTFGRKMRRTFLVPLFLLFCPFTSSVFEGEDNEDYYASSGSSYDESYYDYDTSDTSADADHEGQ